MMFYFCCKWYRLFVFFFVSLACSHVAIAADIACPAELTAKTNQLRIYQIMVESFVDGDPSIGYQDGYGTSSHGGDLQGVIDSLDYIKSLGMNAIWLTPIFASNPIPKQTRAMTRLDATGYFASNYFQIDPHFGTLAKAKELVEKAHKKGLYVFLDGVFGHHKSNIVPSPEDRLPKGPAAHVSYPQSLAFYKEVIEYWTRTLKIDGWRLDQAYQVPISSWVKLRQTVRVASESQSYINAKGQKVHPLGYMVGEDWSQSPQQITKQIYGNEQQVGLCSAFAFPLRYRLVEAFAVDENGVSHKGAKWLAQGLALQHQLYPGYAQPNLMIGNHDLVRFGDLLQRGRIADPDESMYWQRHRAALSFLGTYSGPITLYYGEEVGSEVPYFEDKVPSSICVDQGLCDDHVARSPAVISGVNGKFSDTQQALHDFVKKLMNIRSLHPALYNGKRINIRANPSVFIDYKYNHNDVVLYVQSMVAEPQTITLNQQEIAATGALNDLFEHKRIQPDAKGDYHLPLSGFQARILQIMHPGGQLPVIDHQPHSAHYQGVMGRCDNPDVAVDTDFGPLYLVGNFPDGQWKFKQARQFHYKGKGLYQLVVKEKMGSYHFQFATQGWNHQYTLKELSLSPGVAGEFKLGGYGQDTVAVIPKDGHYVWSLKFSPNTQKYLAVLAKCP